MSSRSQARLEVGLYAAAAAIMIALIVWICSQPHARAVPQHRPAADHNPCALVAGPAKDLCNTQAAASSTPQPSTASNDEGLRVWRGDSFLVPATIAVAAAVGLAMVAGRRVR